MSTSQHKRPAGRLIMEVVIPIRAKEKYSGDQNNTFKNTPTRVKRNRSVTFDTDYSPGRSIKPFSPVERKITRSLKRRSSSSFSAGPSRPRKRSNTPSPSDIPMSPSSSSSSQRNNLQSLTTAVDFITHPDAILVESGDDLEIIISSDPPATERVNDENKPAIDIDPVHHAVDMRKLSPSPEPEDMEEPELDCAICYESIKDICKKAEEEGRGGIAGSLAMFACDQAGCGGIFCLSCIIETTNHNIRHRKAITCPLCTRPADLAPIRAQAKAFNPADENDPIIQAPPAPPPPPARAPPANTHLRDQHVHSVVAFHRASRPGRRYFVNSFEEFYEFVKTNNPAAAAVNPAGVIWLATSSWEAFWATYRGRTWRGLPRLRANAYLMTLIKGLDINMPPELAPLVGPAAEAARVQAIERPARVARRVAFALGPRRDPEFGRAMIEEIRAEQAANREALAVRRAAQGADEAQAHAALERLEVPARPPVGQVAAPHITLGVDRPHFIHHLVGMDMLLAEHLPEVGRRGMMRAMLGLQTDREADIIYGNLRRAYGLDMVRPEVPPTAAELARMDVMRHAWALLNEGRRALFAAQAHQLPVAEFDLPDLPDVVEAQPEPPQPVRRAPRPFPPILLQ